LEKSPSLCKPQPDCCRVSNTDAYVGGDALMPHVCWRLQLQVATSTHFLVQGPRLGEICIGAQSLTAVMALLAYTEKHHLTARLVEL